MSIIPDLSGKTFRTVTDYLDVVLEGQTTQRLFNERPNKNETPPANPSISGNRIRGWEGYKPFPPKPTYTIVNGINVSNDWLVGTGASGEIYNSEMDVWFFTVQAAIVRMKDLHVSCLSWQEWCSILGCQGWTTSIMTNANVAVINPYFTSLLVGGLVSMRLKSSNHRFWFCSSDGSKLGMRGIFYTNNDTVNIGSGNDSSSSFFTVRYKPYAYEHTVLP